MQLLEEFKEYLRIDGDEEDSSLLSFLQSAITYLESAGVKQPADYYLKVTDKDVFSLHRLAVMTLATHFYENRIIVASKATENILPYGLQSMILQLKWVNPDELSAQ